MRVDAWTVLGNVTVRGSAPVTARTVDGDVKVGTAVGPVVGETVNGSVDVRMTTIGDTGEVRAETTNGSATAYVPEIADGAVDVGTLNGRIGSDFGSATATGGVVGHEYQWSVGSGARNYKVKSLNGSAWLRLINADGSVGASSAAPAAPVAPRKAAGKAVRPAK